MNKYWIIGLIIALFSGAGFMYYQGISKEKAVSGEADAKHDLAQAGVTVAAQKGVITAIANQQGVTQGVDNAYEAKKSSIDNDYVAGFVGVRSTPVTTGNNFGALSGSPSRPNAAPSRPLKTKVYGLNAKECDDNTAQLYGLQAWVRGQKAIGVK